MRKKTGIIKKLIFACAAALVLLLGYNMIFPNISKLKTHNPDITSFMEYRQQEYADKGKKIKIRKAWVPLSAISPYLAKAVIIAEDDKFWRHEGFDYEAIQKALEKDIKTKKLKFGGSTISQQLAKNLFLNPSKNPVRKIREAILTWRIEQTLSKKRILELYLNSAEWGEGIFGAEAASQRYFGKHASALSAFEAAKLAAVLPNPRRFSAASETGYAQRRAQLIYSIMVRRGIVTEEYEEAAGDKKEGETSNEPGIDGWGRPVEPASEPVR